VTNKERKILANTARIVGADIVTHLQVILDGEAPLPNDAYELAQSSFQELVMDGVSRDEASVLARIIGEYSWAALQTALHHGAVHELTRGEEREQREWREDMGPLR
jgi:hypothetical protein